MKDETKFYDEICIINEWASMVIVSFLFSIKKSLSFSWVFKTSAK